MGFTLLELLVVLLIVGVGWFALLPSLDLAEKSVPVSQGVLSSLLHQARKASDANQTIEIVLVTLGHSELHWRGHKVELETNVLRCEVNEQTPPGLSRKIRLYPAGHMDAVTMELGSGERLTFGPLDESVRPAESP